MDYPYQRKETLLVEYERRHKSGGIRDLRIGESDPSMSAEEKMLQRYAVEKQVSSFLYTISVMRA